MIEASRKRQFTAEDLWRMCRVGGPVPVPGRDAVIVPVTTYDLEANEGREVLHLAPASGGDATRPITTSEASSSQPAVSPDGKHVAFVRKPRGKDKPQLHVMPLDGGEARSLGDFPLGAHDPRWLPDGARVCVLAPVYKADMTLAGTKRLAEERAKNPVKAHVTEDRVYRYWDRWLTDGEVPHLFVVDVATGEARDLTPDSDRWLDLMESADLYDVSPDGEEALLSMNTSRSPHARTRMAIFSVPIAGGEMRCLTPDNPADDARPRYSPDGRHFVYGMKRDWDVEADRFRLVRVDRATGEHVVLTEAWERSPAEWTFADAHTLIGTVEDDARSRLFRLDISGGPRAPEILSRDGSLHAPRAAAGGVVYAQHSSLSSPPEIVRLAPGGGVERVTHFNDERLAALALGEVADVRFSGADGDAVQMFVVYPPGYDRARRWPLVHMIHGGPYGCFGDVWHNRWNSQVIAAQGYVVAMVNFHGSTSFGDAYARSILGGWGDKPGRDVIAATDHLLETAAIDPLRVAITGGSYGGYLTCWLASQTDRFACAIAHAAVFNVWGMYGSDVSQGLERELGAEPWGAPEARAAADRMNPSSFVAGYKTPMLVIHGEQDFRVPASNALELYGMLKAKGVEARLVHYPDENHWILKPKNSLHWLGEFTGWLARHFGPRADGR